MESKKDEIIITNFNQDESKQFTSNFLILF